MEWIHTEYAYDYGLVQISNDDGKTWTTVSRSPHSTGSRQLWSKNIIPLDTFAGQTIRLGFNFASTCRISLGSCRPANGNGWYIDDIKIE